MKEIGLICYAWEVRAILEGRKTQTRRVVKLPVKDPSTGCELAGCELNGILRNDERVCPYGAPGHRLWVRETWVELLHTSPATDEPLLCEGDKLVEHATKRDDGRWNYDGRVISYRATSNVEFCDGDGCSSPDFANKNDMPKWRPSIHMPRWASRITLEIEAVRVERLQDISEEDARAEGCEESIDSSGDWISMSDVYADLWTSINGAGSWDANPWVWVIQFRRVKP